MTCINTIPQLPPFKRGDTFILSCVYKQDGTPTSVELFTIRAQLRDSIGALVKELTVTKANQTTNAGVFTLSAGITTSWPLDLLRADIQFTEAGTIRSTQTIEVEVIEGITS
jgi:hypothetical protein